MNTVKKVIWTIGRNPFAFGVSYQVWGTEIEGVEMDLGRGYKGIVAFTPKGNTVVAELETGAIVGSTVKQVREDIRRGDIQAMAAQVNDAKIQMRSLKIIPSEEFWRRYEGK